MEAWRKQMLAIDGVVESPSAFRPGIAFWCNGKEIAHFDGPDVIDRRLTKAVIREFRAVLSEDARVELRKGSSDWIEAHVRTEHDIAFVIELTERAAGAHRAGSGEVAKSPPAGTELKRRRRLHRCRDGVYA